MRNDKLTLGFAYLRLSNEEAQGGESSSITNQRMIVQNYCKQNGITLVREFVDDGYSGGNFDRPAFQEMMKQLQQGKANTVITKDLSRLGRDMREASYYAEQFFPEHGIHYIAISDNFDSERENIMAPFLFAMNEVYLLDGSRKVKDVLRSKREKIEARIGTIDKIVTKLYPDNAAGDLDDDRLRRMVADLEKESAGLQAALDSLTISRSAGEIESSYANFSSLAREYTQIQELDRETLPTFVERIEIGSKKYPEGTVKATHRNQPYRQSIRIVYKFIGEVAEESVRELPTTAEDKANDTPA